MKIFLIGGPGSGKSTVGKRMAGDLRWQFISTGEILRESKEPWVIEKLKTAQLFDDEMISELVMTRIRGADNVIIDGFLRTLRQAEIAIEKKIGMDLLLELVVPLEEIQKRLMNRGRDQDEPEIVMERYLEYERNKTKVLAYLVGNGKKLVSVNGVGGMDEVYKRAVMAVRSSL